MTTEMLIRRKALQLQTSMKFNQSAFARKARINRTMLNMFLQGHIPLRPDQLASIDKAIAAVARRSLETIRELLPSNDA